MTDPVRVLIGGVYHDRWQSYRLDSDLLLPADDWTVSVSFEDGDGEPETLPPLVVEGASAQIMLGDDLILDGIVDDIEEDASKRARRLELYGRDRAALLLDCAAPLVTLQQATLEQIVKKAVSLVGIKNVRYDAKPSAPRRKVQTEPGQTIWEWLHTACEANQVWPWFTPDGVLVIGQPDYKTPPVADIVLRFDGRANNALSVGRRRSLRASYSEVTVLGQSAFDGEVGGHDIKAVAKDKTVPMYRPFVAVDGNCETTALAKRRAEKLIADGRMSRDLITVKVEGHRIRDGAGAGRPWTPGMRLNVYSEPHRLYGAVYFLIRRTFVKSRSEHCTKLHLIPDGTWMLNIPPKEKPDPEDEF
jgi:prophage tail gpP-like protein